MSLINTLVLAFALLPAFADARPLCSVRSTVTITSTTTIATAIPSTSSVPTSILSTSSDASSSAPSATPSAPSTNTTGSSDISSILFPVTPQLSSWTTSSSLSGALPLSDDTFQSFKNIKELSHNTTTAPDGELSIQAHYPAGSYNFGHEPRGGFSFYAPGPSDVNLTTAKEATFGYSVYFPEGFQFVKGGKLPGLYGGDSDDEAVSCSGGRRDDGCWSSRLMWRTDGLGELYTYLPPDFDANQAVCDIPPFSTCNDVYGASVGRGSFNWTAGGRTTMSQRVRLNDVGQSNGELELFVGGQSVVNVGGLVLTNSTTGRIRGMQMQTFFGGSDSSWASPVDQDVYFSDFSVAITESL